MPSRLLWVRTIQSQRPKPLQGLHDVRKNYAIPARYHGPHVRMSMHDGQPVPYDRLRQNLDVMRARLDNKPLTLAQKILYAHLNDPQEHEIGKAKLQLLPDRLACRDSIAPTVLAQFLLAGLEKAAVPTSVHCVAENDKTHVNEIDPAHLFGKDDYNLIADASAKYGVRFWKHGPNTIHQAILKHYAFPGGLVTCAGLNAHSTGGLGTIVLDIGEREAAEVMAGLPCKLEHPRVIGIRLSGRLSGWVAPKDIVLKLAMALEKKGTRGAILEYYGSGAESMSSGDMATVCDMATKLGATASVFPFTQSMFEYLCATGRQGIANAARSASGDLLRPDNGAEYEQVIDLNLSDLEPYIDGPFMPILTTTVEGLKGRVASEDWPEPLSAVVIGPSRNASEQVIERAANVARQALNKGLKLKAPLLVVPSSEHDCRMIEQKGLHGLFKKVGGTVIANGCGPGGELWHKALELPTPNSVLICDGCDLRYHSKLNPNSHVFVASPEIAMAMAFGGKLSYDPTRDRIVGADGLPFVFEPPDNDNVPEAALHADDDQDSLLTVASNREGTRIEMRPSQQ